MDSFHYGKILSPFFFTIFQAQTYKQEYASGCIPQHRLLLRQNSRLILCIKSSLHSCWTLIVMAVQV